MIVQRLQGRQQHAGGLQAAVLLAYWIHVCIPADCKPLVNPLTMIAGRLCNTCRGDSSTLEDYKCPPDSCMDSLLHTC
jgi:hypothetical protein